MLDSSFHKPASRGVQPVSRRAFTLAAASLPVLAVPGAARSRSGATLQDVAGRVGMLFGSAVWASRLETDPGYREAIARHCGIVTPEAELNWSTLEPERGRFDFRGADTIAAFARAMSKTMYGHSLIWHLSVPDWATEALATEPSWELVRGLLSSVVPRYRGVAHGWDVINEPIEPTHGRSDGLRVSSYLTAFGPQYIERALEEARALDPTAKLFVNDYGLDYAIPEEEARRRALLALLERLVKAGAPLNGLGIQAHLDLAKHAHFSPRILADFLNEVGMLGLEIRISEMDVKEADMAQSLAQRDQAVADAARAFLEVALANRAVGSVTFWGLTDRYSWLNRGDTINRGLPFDENLRAKPLFEITRSLIARRPALDKAEA